MKKLLVLILAVALTAAGLSVAALAEANIADFLGTWYAEDTAYGYDRTEINEDGTIVFYPFDATIDPLTGNWTAEGDGLIADVGEVSGLTLTLADNILSIDDGTYTVTFTKDVPLAPEADEFIGTWYGEKPDNSAYAITFFDDMTYKIYPTSDMSEDSAKSGTWSLGTRNIIMVNDDGAMAIATEMDGCMTVSDTDGSNSFAFLSDLDISQ